jgi:hypothetical protein
MYTDNTQLDKQKVQVLFNLFYTGASSCERAKVTDGNFLKVNTCFKVQFMCSLSQQIASACVHVMKQPVLKRMANFFWPVFKMRVESRIDL